MMGRVFKKERLVKELFRIILLLVDHVKINPVVLHLYLQLEMTLI